MANDSRPGAGLSVVELAGASSDLGLGLAGGVPGRILTDLGAHTTRVVDPVRPAIDAGLAWSHPWHRGKEVVVTDDPEQVRALLDQADVALVYGTEARVEQAGLGYHDLEPTNPGLVYGRCRPSRTARGSMPDYALLVEADSGFCTQLAGHRPGPIFVDVRAAGAGAAFLLTTSVLALLRRRALTGRGGWAETSLYDGMLATIGTMIGRSERAPTEVESYWEHGSTFPNFLYRCADGELIQVWFGGKGMYAKLLEVLGDEPSTDGYYTDQAKGALQERAKRWTAFFDRQPRDVWIERLRGAGIACEPVLGPGDALADPHLAEVGLAVDLDAGGERETVVGTPIAVHPVTSTDVSPLPVSPPPRRGPSRGLLDGVRVVDFSAFVAGPLGAQVLADFGADVIKVEPPEGEAMRAAAYAVAACQRGKRSLALDLGAADARPVVEALLRWADVVLHNFRVGVSARLGIDEATVAELNPQAVYCHASAFGPDGPRARFPGNDALMQALTGFERAVGGVGNDPTAATWIPIDMTGGWVAAAGVLAGLYAQSTSGRGQQVATSLLGAGMLLQSGVYQRDGHVVDHPELDADQTGYGPGYRIYRAADDRWLAVVVPDADAWGRLAGLADVDDLPAAYAPLRHGDTDADARRAERVLEAAIASQPAAIWRRRLDDIGVLAEVIEPLDRDAFRSRILDDPVNQQLGRMTSFATADWGHFEQIGRLLRCGPDADVITPLHLPGVGEHTVGVLHELGFGDDQVSALLDAKVARQG
jgi:crotonobetainyl-CoA:carnitine CoA-transferase CaiB-like acyl-CoA transferase